MVFLLGIVMIAPHNELSGDVVPVFPGRVRRHRETPENL
jgi:hypothetical protein